MSDTPPSELDLLRRELALVVARVDLLEVQLRDLQAAPRAATAAPVTVNYSFLGSPSTASGSVADSVVPGADARQSPVPVSQGAAQYSEEFRSRVAAEAGLFVRRALDGLHRGESGRDRVKLQSRIYLVFRDFRGTVYNPVKVCNTFGEVKHLVKPDGHAGDSVFLGLPSLWEARLCAREAGVTWPSDVGTGRN